MIRRKKHSRTGTERGSSIDQMIEKLGGSGGGAMRRLKIKTDVKGKVDRTKLRMEAFRSLPKELQKQVVTNNGKVAMNKVRSKMNDLKKKVKLSLPQKRTLQKLGNLAAAGAGAVVATGTAAVIGKQMAKGFEKQWKRNSQKKKDKLKIKKKNKDD